jgi:hypothetical protein
MGRKIGGGNLFGNRIILSAKVDRAILSAKRCKKAVRLPGFGAIEKVVYSSLAEVQRLC